MIHRRGFWRYRNYQMQPCLVCATTAETYEYRTPSGRVVRVLFCPGCDTREETNP